MSEDEPEYTCPACEWQGDEDDGIVCGGCCAILCPKCHEPIEYTEDYNKALAQDAHDAELEDRRLML